MNFTSPSRVDDVIRRMQDTSIRGDENMARINALFNGDPPWTTAEAKKQKVQINCPSMRAPQMMDNARGQWETAFTSRDKYFRYRLNYGPPEKRLEYSLYYTKCINDIMKRKAEFTSTVCEVGASTMLHGRGPVFWIDEDLWAPEMVGLGDLKIPARTYANFSNLGYYAVYKRFTPFTLFEQALGDHRDPQWNAPLIKEILARLADVNTEATNFKTWMFPADLVEDFKDQSGYWSSDAVPTINAWDFRFRDDKRKGWWRGVILDRDNPTSTNAYKIRRSDKDEMVMEWLYAPTKEPFASSIDQQLQVIYANGCHVPPFRYASVRGLGYRLYDDALYEAMARNRFREKVLQEMLDLFYNVGLVDGREQLESIWLSHMGIMPQGTKMVPANERYRPDLNFVLAGLNETREGMSEQSSSYMMNFDQGDDSETATRTMARVQSSNAMVGNFLNKAYDQWRYVGIEINRRFLRKNSQDPDVREFRKKVLEDGIPEELLKPEYWDCEPERVSGNGNRILASQMAANLMALYNRLPPQGQRLALRMAVDTSIDDPALGEAIVPIDKEEEPSPTVKQAYSDIGALMQGLPAPLTSSENQIEYVETLLTNLSQLVQRIDQTGGMVRDQRELFGLATVSAEIAKRIALIDQDPGEAARVKQYEDIHTRLNNQIKAFAQRLAEQQKAQGQQGNSELNAKIQALLITAQSQAKIKEAAAQQKMQHKQQAFVADQRRKDLAAGIDATRKLHDARLDTAITDLTTSAEIRNANLAAANDRAIAAADAAAEPTEPSPS